MHHRTGTDVMFLKIFSPKIWGNIGVFAQKYDLFLQNMDHNIVFEKTPISSSKIGKNR
jgi:hypothetical protein